MRPMLGFQTNFLKKTSITSATMTSHLEEDPGDETEQCAVRASNETVFVPRAGAQVRWMMRQGCMPAGCQHGQPLEVFLSSLISLSPSSILSRG